MTFINTVGYKLDTTPPPVPDAGKYISVDTSGASSLSTYNLIKTVPGIARNGNFMFYSAYYRAQDIATYPRVATTLKLISDSELEVTLEFNVDANGRFTAITLTLVGLGDGIIAQSTNYNLNYTMHEWMWLCAYIDVNNRNNTLIYINGVELLYLDRVVSNTDSGGADTIFRSYGVVSNGSSSYAAIWEIAHQWFATAATNTVIGDPSFVKEFTNTDGTAKDLGNGTVLGVVPHYYFSCATNPFTNEATGEVWDVETTGTGDAFVVTAGDETEIKWYGDVGESAYEIIQPSGGNYFVILRQVTNVPCVRLLLSYFIKMLQVTDYQQFVLYTYTSNSTSTLARLFRIELHRECTQGAPLVFAAISDSTIRYNHTFNAPFTAQVGDWVHVCVYFERTGGGNIWCTANGIPIVGTTTTDTLNTNAKTDAVREAAGLNNMRLAHMVWYEEDVIAANQQIPWATNTLYQNFVNPDLTPKDIGIDGSLALGIKPSGYQNTSLKLGAFAVYNPYLDKLQSIEVDYASVNANTKYYKETIAPTVPLLRKP